MADFEVFLDAAHARGMRVIPELVVNHASDEHPRMPVFLRRYDDETILVAANLAHSVQPVTVDLPPSAEGQSPVEVLDARCFLQSGVRLR